MINSRQHPFNRSTRPLLHNNDDPYATTASHPHNNYPSTATTKPATGPLKLLHVSAPTAQQQIMRGFHDFDYVPKTSFYGGYPYGSPPSPTPRIAALRDEDDADDDNREHLQWHHFQSTATNSDDSGLHSNITATTTLTQPTGNSICSDGRSSSPTVAPFRPLPPIPPPQQQQQRQQQQQPQRYYVDDDYEDDDGYAGGRIWRPYGVRTAVVLDKKPTAQGDGSGREARPVISTKQSKEKKVKKLKAKQVKAYVEEDEPIAIKCVVVGDGAVGKTNLICSYLENRFVGEHIPTASDMFNFEVTVNESPVRVTLCDTAGQDALDALRRLSYPDSDVFVLCFSVVRPDTFRALQRKWLPQLQQRLQKDHRRKSQSPAILLVGTQADLRTDAAVLNALQRCGAERPVPMADAYIVAQSVGAQYVETSSRFRWGVKDAFDAAIWQALAQRQQRGEGRKGGCSGGGGCRRSFWRRLFCMG